MKNDDDKGQTQMISNNISELSFLYDCTSIRSQSVYRHRYATHSEHCISATDKTLQYQIAIYKGMA